jgi:hypothetical protein
MIGLVALTVLAGASQAATVAFKETMCSSNTLRASASGLSTSRKVVPAGTVLSVSATVTGRAYTVSCAGRSVSGTTWYRVTAIGGTSIDRFTSDTSVYIAAGFVKAVSIHRTASCAVGLRTSPKSTSTRKVVIPTGAKVTVAAKVSGGSWVKDCAGRERRGSSWYRITAVNGVSTKSRYGLSALYAPSGVFDLAASSISGRSVRVTSIRALLTSLADNAIGEIVVANGTYRVSPASSRASNSLWIGSRFAGRTRAVTVRAETRGKVTFDGGGTSTFGGLTFVDGAHHQTWDGFRFANGKPTQTGVIVFGGYGQTAPHHITLRHLTMLPSIVASTANNDHLIYFSKDAAHDILIEDYTATPGASIKSALQFYHSPNAYNVTVRRMHVVGTQSAILMYDGTVHNVLIEDSDIKNARDVALNVATIGTNVVLRNVTSVNSGGTYYPNGKPAGLSLVNCSFH